MSDEKTDKSDYDEDVLAALTRPSLANDLKADDDDGALDLSALVGGSRVDEPEEAEVDDGRISLAGPVDEDAAELPAADSTTASKVEDSETKDKKDTTTEAKAPAKAEPATKVAKNESEAVVASVVPDEEKSGSGMWLIGGVALVAAVAVGFALTRGPSEAEDEQTEIASAGSSEVDEPAIEVVDERDNEEIAEAVGTENAEVENTDEGDGETAETHEADNVGDDEAAAETESDSEETVLAMAETNRNTQDTQNTQGAERDDTRRDGRTGSRTTATAGSTSSMTGAATSGTSTMTSTMERTEAPETTEASGSTMAPPSSNELDDLLNSALGDRNAADGDPLLAGMSARMNEPAEELPEKPSRTTTTRILNGLLPRMRRCADGQVGTANGRIRVSNEGRVVSASVSGSPFGGTPQGSCMEDVIRTARFPRFSDPHMDVSYPFTIRAIN